MTFFEIKVENNQQLWREQVVYDMIRVYGADH
jgi:hypothetical protein